MNICINCRHFVAKTHECGNCKHNVCKNCILTGDEPHRYPHFNNYQQLCSKCQCAGCLQKNPGALNVGYDKCNECKLQYCSECSNNNHLCCNTILAL